MKAEGQYLGVNADGLQKYSVVEAEDLYATHRGTPLQKVCVAKGDFIHEPIRRVWIFPALQIKPFIVC